MRGRIVPAESADGREGGIGRRGAGPVAALRQEFADVYSLPVALLRLNEVPLRVKDEAEPPDHHRGARHRVDGEVPARHHRLDVAVLQGSPVYGAGSVERRLVLRFVEPRRGEDKPAVGQFDVLPLPLRSRLKGNSQLPG